MHHSKQLKKLDAQTNIALSNYEIQDPKTKFVKYLDMEPNLEQKELAVLLPITVPLMMAGFLVPTLMELQTDYILPGGEQLPYVTFAMAVSVLFTRISSQSRRNIASSFKYELGHKLSKEKTKELRRIQKSLEPGKTKLLPASEVFETTDIIDFTAAKGLELNILVSSRRVALQWGKPLSSGELWDETVDDLVDMFDLVETNPGQVFSSSYVRRMILKINQDA